MIPGLPAHILFMCVRYADSLNDANMLKSLMNSTINGIKQVVKVGTTFDIGPWYYGYFRNTCGNDQMPVLFPSFTSSLWSTPWFLKPVRGPISKRIQAVRKRQLRSESPKGGDLPMDPKFLPARLQSGSPHATTSVPRGCKEELAARSMCLSR